MTSLICAISNEVPENPVVSPVSGQVWILLLDDDVFMTGDRCMRGG